MTGAYAMPSSSRVPVLSSLRADPSWIPDDRALSDFRSALALAEHALSIAYVHADSAHSSLMTALRRGGELDTRLVERAEEAANTIERLADDCNERRIGLSIAEARRNQTTRTLRFS